RQRRDILEAARHRLDPRGREREAVDERGALAGRLRPLGIAAVGVEERPLGGPDPRRRLAERRVLRTRRRSGERACRGARRGGQHLAPRAGIARCERRLRRRRVWPTVSGSAPTPRSSRWLSTALPWPPPGRWMTRGCDPLHSSTTYPR